MSDLDRWIDGTERALVEGIGGWRDRRRRRRAWAAVAGGVVAVAVGAGALALVDDGPSSVDVRVADGPTTTTVPTEPAPERAACLDLPSPADRPQASPGHHLVVLACPNPGYGYQWVARVVERPGELPASGAGVELVRSILPGATEAERAMGLATNWGGGLEREPTSEPLLATVSRQGDVLVIDIDRASVRGVNTSTGVMGAFGVPLSGTAFLDDTVAEVHFLVDGDDEASGELSQSEDDGVIRANWEQDLAYWWRQAPE